jgi:hypothetical protein
VTGLSCARMGCESNDEAAGVAGALEVAEVAGAADAVCTAAPGFDTAAPCADAIGPKPAAPATNASLPWGAAAVLPCGGVANAAASEGVATTETAPCCSDCHGRSSINTKSTSPAAI